MHKSMLLQASNEQGCAEHMICSSLERLAFRSINELNRRPAEAPTERLSKGLGSCIPRDRPSRDGPRDGLDEVVRGRKGLF